MKRTAFVFAVVMILAGSFYGRIARADDAAALAKKHACTACHALDKKLVGPAYKDVAAKYKGNKDAQNLLVKKVLDGGSGVWGAIPMPPNKGKVKDDEVRTLVKWVLAQ